MLVCQRGGLHPFTLRLLLHPPLTHKHPLCSYTSLVMCRGLWYQVSCVSLQVDVCFHAICWALRHRRPLWSQPPSLIPLLLPLFSPSYVPMREGWDLSNNTTSYVWPVNFFCPGNSLSPDTPLVLEMSIQVEAKIQFMYSHKYFRFSCHDVFFLMILLA